MSQRKFLHTTPSPFSDWRNFEILTYGKGGFNIETEETYYVFQKLKNQSEWDSIMSYPDSNHGSGSLTTIRSIAGVKIVPESHNLYGNGTAGYASLYWPSGIECNNRGFTYTKFDPPTGLGAHCHFTSPKRLRSLDLPLTSRTRYRNAEYTEDRGLNVAGFTREFEVGDSIWQDTGYGDVTCRAVSGLSCDNDELPLACPFIGDYHHAQNLNRVMFEDLGSYGRDYTDSTDTVTTSLAGVIKKFNDTYPVCKWYIPSIKELLYFAAQFKAFNDLTTYYNRIRAEKMGINISGILANYNWVDAFELVNFTMASGVLAFEEEHPWINTILDGFFLLSSTPVSGLTGSAGYNVPGVFALHVEMYKSELEIKQQTSDYFKISLATVTNDTLEHSYVPAYVIPFCRK